MAYWLHIWAIVVYLNTTLTGHLILSLTTFWGRFIPKTMFNVLCGNFTFDFKSKWAQSLREEQSYYLRLTLSLSLSLPLCHFLISLCCSCSVWIAPFPPSLSLALSGSDGFGFKWLNVTPGGKIGALLIPWQKLNIHNGPVEMDAPYPQVWDGTRCAHPLQDFSVDASLIEGPSSLAGGRSDLAVKILVFDNHAEIARKIKVRGPSVFDSYCKFSPWNVFFNPEGLKRTLVSKLSAVGIICRQVCECGSTGMGDIATGGSRASPYLEIRMFSLDVCGNCD